MLGNDIVDTTVPEAWEKATHRRFLNRVFTGAEIGCIDRDADPTGKVWALFAAKEAVFKAVKKLRPEYVLGPRSIEVSTGDGGDIGTAVAGEWNAQLRWERAEGFVHCVAWLGQGPWPSVQTLVERADAAEASGRLRELAAERLTSLGWIGTEIRRDAGRASWRAPRVYQNGNVLPQIEISFSHDGDLVALAYLTSSNSTSKTSVALGGMTPPAPRSP